MRAVTDKVLCYVVRDGRLLVVRHNEAKGEEVVPRQTPHPALPRR